MPSTRPHTIAVVKTHNKALLILLATLLQSKKKKYGHNKNKIQLIVK